MVDCADDTISGRLGISWELVIVTRICDDEREADDGAGGVEASLNLDGLGFKVDIDGLIEWDVGLGVEQGILTGLGNEGVELLVARRLIMAIFDGVV